MTHHAMFYGGGLDSTAQALLLHHVGRAPALLHVDYGQAAADAEWGHSTKRLSALLGAPAHQVKVAFDGLPGAIMKGSTTVATSQQTAKLDGRNLLLLGVVAPLAAALGYEQLYLGLHQEPTDTPMLDSLPAFVDAANVFLQKAVTAPLAVQAPFHSLERNETILTAAALYPDLFDIAHTCYSGSLGGCGLCSHCKQLQQLRLSTPCLSTNVLQVLERGT